MEDNIELNPMILEIAKMAAAGMTDARISSVIGKSISTVYLYRHKYGIKAGRHNRQDTESKAVNSQEPCFQMLNELYL